MTSFLHNFFSQTLYVGEHEHGLYAMPSLVDEQTLTISPTTNGPLLLEGPQNFQVPTEINLVRYSQNVFFFFWFKRVLDCGPEQRESKLTVLCLLIIIILISYIIIELLTMENHPSQNWKQNSLKFCLQKEHL